uniref:Peptidase C1A papain C-terminal domain-containing protein n=1 Tax=Meloidogyne enterolobii TaxID=390850 RepID=A0A6V7WZ36_MELEN|nr:unnamed protein product [Meloidogyne enterolobii]
MKKIIILFSIFLIINISTTTSDPLEDLLGGLLGGILGGVLGTLKNLLRNLLGSTLPLSEEDLQDLAEKLKELSRSGYTISSEELLKRAKEIAEINRLTGGEWTAHFNLESLLPLEVQKRLYGSLTTKANKGNDDEDGADKDGPPREKRQARRSKRAASCTYNIEFDARDRWPSCKPIINYVQTQGHCGSCWAHSAASCYTDRYCINEAKNLRSTPFNASYIFSAYEILSCSKENGCKGGSEEEAYRWIKKNGICTGTDYQRQDGCKPYPFNPGTNNPQLTGCSQTCTNSKWKIPYDTDRKHYGTLKLLRKINLMSSICSDRRRLFGRRS